MKLFSKKLPDDEFVEKIRKNIHTRRRLRWVFVSLFIIAVVAYVILLPGLVALTSGMAADLSGSCDYYWTGFPFGGFYALLFIFVFVNGVLFLHHRFFSRTEALALKYFDQARELRINDEKDVADLERIRLRIDKNRGFRWLWVIGSVIIFMSLSLFDTFMGTAMSQENMILGTLLLGFGSGFFVFGKIGVLLVLLYALSFMKRETALLVKYHDLVSQKDCG